MNDKDYLLADTLGDDDGELFARIAAAHARRRRGVKQGLAAAGALTVFLAALLTFRQPTPHTQPGLDASASTSVLQIISDEELLAQLKNESVLVLKDQSGISGIVFLADHRRPTQTQ
jgi:hypothetical protein